jgi:two-component system C4-dicarboxylate transport response regulator DctD
MIDFGPKQVAVVDDDAAIRAAVSQTLTLAGLDPIPFEAAAAALEALSADFEGVVVADLRMPGMDGLTLQRRLQAVDPELPVMLITGHGDIEDAVSAMQGGAYDFIPKPFSADRLLASIHRALAFRRLVLENRRLLAATSAAEPDLPILGETGPMHALRRALAELAKTDAHVLVEGDAGVGKEHAARVLHQASARRLKPFVVVECAALTEAGCAEALFGQSRRSSSRPRMGHIEAANGGALFLHDIDRAVPALQAALARVLEERSFVPTDEDDMRPVSLRVIAVSERPLLSLVRAGAFRADLYYSIAKATLHVPPLRERRADIALLFANFQAEAARRLGRPVPSLSDAVRADLLTHDWPGNVRELQQYAERVVLGLANDLARPASDNELSLPARVNAFEARLLEDALQETSGDVRAALERLKIPRKTFYDKVAKHNIRLEDFRPKARKSED